MDEFKLKAMISQEIDNSLGYYGGKLTEQRRKFLEYYLGEPYGNEVEGRSQVTSQDTLEVVESVLPSLMRIFTAGESIVEFVPVGPEDVEAAEQATDYCNHILMKDNPGFMTLHTWFKDALIQKNGFVKVFWNEAVEEKKETYENLTEIEYQSLLADEDVEIISKTENLEEEEIMDDMGMPMMSQRIYYDCEVRRKKNVGKVQIENVPPEEMLISRDAKDIQTADFIAHRVTKTRSQLIREGFDRDVVMDLPAFDEQVYNEEKTSRRIYDDQAPYEQDSSDPTMAEVQVTECYMRVDYDGDDIGELRKITVAGQGYEILDNVEIDHIPFATLTPIPMPHRFFGLSLTDLTADLQLIKTTVLRQTLDNMYLQNNARTIVTDGQVNLDDLLTSRPGGIVRVKSPNAVQPFPTPNFLNQGLSMMEKIDQIKEQRTGVSRTQMGADPDLIQKSHTTATSVNALMNAATQRIEMIARVFAETGIRDMFKLIYANVVKYQEAERIIRLRGKYVPVDPRSWVSNMDLTITVGLGSSDTQQRAAALAQILALQEKIIQAGGMGTIVDMGKIYNTISKIVEVSGYKSPELFFNNPANIPPQPPEPKQEEQNPLVGIALQELELKRQKDMADIQLQQQKLEADIAIQKQKILADIEKQKIKNEGDIQEALIKRGMR